MKRYARFSDEACLLASVALAALVVASCDSSSNDGGHDATAIVGSWNLASIAVSGMSADCPGEIELIYEPWFDTEIFPCGTQVSTFNADGSYVEVASTDASGSPYDLRQEGAWLTNGNTIRVTYTEMGPDEDNLTPIDPPWSGTGVWSATEGTLRLRFPKNPSISDIPLTANFERQ